MNRASHAPARAVGQGNATSNLLSPARRVEASDRGALSQAGRFALITGILALVAGLLLPLGWPDSAARDVLLWLGSVHVVSGVLSLVWAARWRARQPAVEP